MAEPRREYTALYAILLGIVGYMLTGLFLSCMLEKDPAPTMLKVQRGGSGSDTAKVANLPVRAYDLLSRTDTVLWTDREVNSPDADVMVGSLLFTRNPALITWLTMACILVAFALAALPFGWIVFRRFKALGLTWRQRWGSMGLAIFICALIALTQVLLRGFWSPEKAALALQVMFAHDYISQVPLMVALLSASFFIGCALCVDRASVMLVGSTNPTDVARRFQELRTILRTFLGITSVLVALGVVNSATKRLAIRHFIQVDGLDVYPLEYIHVYGLFFSAFLAMVYLPIQFRLHAIGVRLASEQGGTLGADIQEQLGLKSGPWHDAKGALTILLPLIGSYLPQVFGNITSLLGD